MMIDNLSQNGATFVYEISLLVMSRRKLSQARLYDLDAHIVMIGASYNTVNPWYLAAFRAKQAGAKFDLPLEECWAAVEQDGHRVWTRYQDYQRRCDDFEQIGATFESAGYVSVGMVAITSLITMGL